MGGRIHGFLGGVLLTSALTYYTGEYFQKNLKFISHQLKASDNIINNRILSNTDLIKEGLPVSSHSHATTRVSFAETAKDIWNDEIIKTVNWVYGINWYQIGITADKKILGLTEKLVNSVKEK